MTRRQPYTPMITKVLQTAQGLQNPTPMAVVTRIADQLLAQVTQIAQQPVPPFLKRNSDHDAVLRAIESHTKALAMCKGYSRLKSWNQAWDWLLHAEKIIAGAGPRAQGVEQTLLRVFEFVTLELRPDYEFLALTLGYESVEDANDKTSC